jgi:hypothetical protein
MMHNLSAKSLSDLGSLIKTAEVTEYERTYTGPELNQRLEEVPLAAPLHKVINAVLRDRKARSSSEIHEIVASRGFTENDVRTCMQNVYRRKLVVSIPDLSNPGISKIAYRISSEFWPEDIVSPQPAITPRQVKSISKMEVAELPKFDVNPNPAVDVLRNDTPDIAIWKIMSDHTRRRLVEIIEYLKTFGFDETTLRSRFRTLRAQKWFDLSQGPNCTYYTLRQGIEMPVAYVAPEAPDEPEVHTLDLQNDGARLTIWKIMSDGETRLNKDIAAILEPMAGSTKPLQYLMMRLVKEKWFERGEATAPAGYPIVTYKLRPDVARPQAEPIKKGEYFFKAALGVTQASTPGELLELAGVAPKDDPTANPQASLLPPAASEPGDLQVARNLGLQTTNVHQFRHPDANPALAASAIAAAALSEGEGEVTAASRDAATAMTLSKAPLQHAEYFARRVQQQGIASSHLHDAPEELVAALGAAHEAIIAATPLVEHIVKIAGMPVTPEEADELVTELGDLGLGDDRQLIHSNLIKVKMEIKGKEFSIEQVDQIVGYLKKEGFGKHRKQ